MNRESKAEGEMTETTNAASGKWYIAGHNGMVVNSQTGDVTIDEYAKKNLRTVATDLDRDGKYVEFAVAKGSAKELQDYLRTLEAALSAANERADTAERGLAMFTDAMDDSASRFGVLGKSYVTRDEYKNQLSAANERNRQLTEAFPFTLKYTNELVSLCWKGDGDSVYDEVLRAEVIKWLSAVLAEPATSEET